jgi:hypothetical protein
VKPEFIVRQGRLWLLPVAALAVLLTSGCSKTIVDWDDYLGSFPQDFELALRTSDRLEVHVQLDTGDAAALLLMDADNHTRWEARESSYVECRMRLAGTEYDTTLSPAHSGSYFLVLDKPCNCARHVHLTVRRL